VDLILVHSQVGGDHQIHHITSTNVSSLVLVREVYHLLIILSGPVSKVLLVSSVVPVNLDIHVLVNSTVESVLCYI
jgi:hypothetical protein